MAQPTAYVPAHSFKSDSAALANFPGQALDVEFADVKTTTDQIRTNIALIQRDDGALANGAVGYDQLSAALQTAGLAPATAWATAHAYAVGNSVVQASSLYRCLVAHTSGVFATDLAAAKWLLVAALPTITDASLLTSGTLAAARLPNPTASTLGGVESIAAVSHNWISSISTAGVPALSQPAFTDISGQIVAGQIASLPNPSISTLGGVESIAAVSHKWINTISTAGVPTATQPDATDVTYTATGGTARTVGARLSDTYNVTDFGADPTGVADSAPAFRAAILTAPNGSRVLIPNGNYLLNSVDPATGVHILDFSNFPNKALTIQGEGWNLRVGGVYTNPQGSILRIGASIPTTADLFYLPASDRVTGFTLKDFAVVEALGVFNIAHGRNCVKIDTTAGTTGYYEFFTMDNVFIDNTANGYSVYVQGLAGGNTMIDSSIRNCTFMNTRFENVADNITVENCVFGANAVGTANGPNLGIYVSQVSGATNFKILGNNFVNQNGMIVIDRAITPIIAFNEFEQNAGANTHGSMVDILGSVASVSGAVIVGNTITNNSVTGTIPNINIGTAVASQIFANALRENSQSHIIIAAGGDRNRIGSNPSYTNGTIGATTITDGGTRTFTENNGEAWTTYTPTVTSGVNTITTVGAHSGSYLVLGKLLHLKIDVTITTAGTAAGALIVTLPSGMTAKGNCFIGGKEFVLNGAGLFASIVTGASTMSIVKVDNTTIIANTIQAVMSGSIEIA